MSPYNILDWLYYVFFFTILIPLVVAYRKRSNLSKSMRWTAWLLVSLLLLELVAIGLRFNLIRNHFIYYFQTWAFAWFGAAIYAPKLGYKLCHVIALIISILVPVEVIFWVGFNHINSITLTLARALLALSAFITLKELLAAEPAKSLWNQSALYLNAGLLVLGFFSLTTSAFKSYFIESSLNLYYFFDTLAVITYSVAFLFIAWGFHLNRNNRSALLQT